MSESQPGAPVPRHGLWRNQWIFVLAATGAAVGLGNIWRFPYITGENGGGAFILVYLVSVLALGMPIMMSEILLGREGRHSPVTTMRHIIGRLGKSRFWMLIGWLSVITGLFIFSYYAVIAGWTLHQTTEYAGQITGQVSTDDAKSRWDAFLANAPRLILFQTAFVILAVLAVGGGVKKGLEVVTTWCMPGLFLLMLVLLAYSAWQGDFANGLTYMLKVDFSKLGADGMLAAMGQAFFSLSIGMGSLMAYGAYAPSNLSITKAALTITLLDTLVAIVAGLIIFPLVFAYNLEPGSGAGLLFITLPHVFDTIPAGALVGTVFFVLVGLGALTSLIALIEPATAWLVEHFNAKRLRVAISIGVFCWLLGLGSALSFNYWSKLYIFGSMTFFNVIDKLTANFLLPIGGLLIALFAGWVLPADLVREQLRLGTVGLAIWYWLTRVVAPIGVILIFISSL